VQLTVYKTPIIREFFFSLAWLVMKLAGWKLQGQPPKVDKFVLIAVPHTSNWDFPLMICCAFLFHFEIYWMGKESLFRGPAGPIMRWLGGISIDRSKSNDVVQSTIGAFAVNERLVLLIPPEGTRSKVDKWKTGFYHIAHGANVPIARSFLDFGRKIAGFGPTFYTTGYVDKDIAEIQSFYKGMKGKNAKNQFDL
jgi:1-acyl-sn-glycerol-3-phosphate acyltransferase